MKKIVLTLACFISAGMFAQQSLEKGGIQINAGIGTSSWSTPIYAGLDYGVHEDITIGLEGSYQSYDYGGLGLSTTDKFTIIGIGVNANYHFNEVLDIPEKWDLYAGVGFNYYKWSYGGTSNYLGVDFSGTSFGGQLGARYFFTEKFGLNAEFGGGGSTSGGKLGVTFKL
jgi:outer membrane immunogenic protein